MTFDVGSIAGCLLIFVICTCAVFFLASQLRLHFQTGKAVDQTLSDVDKDDAPSMFWLQIVGFISLIIASGMIGIGAVVALFQSLIKG